MAPPPNIFGKNSKSEEQKPRNQKLRVENTGKKTKKKKEEEKKGKEEEELKDEEEEPSSLSPHAETPLTL